jgi:uncharacterized protein
MNYLIPFRLVTINVNKMRQLFIIFFTVCLAMRGHGQQLPEPMVPPRLVNDFTGLLSADQQALLNNKLLAFNDQTSTQIYIITYDDLHGYPANEFAATLGERWGIGQKGKDNGIVILISPANRDMSIQTGYGLEGVVPDAIAKRIIEKEISPAFREGKYYEGLDAATSTLISLTKGEFTADEYKRKTDGGSYVPFIIVVIILFIVFSSLNSSKRRAYSPGKAIPWWLLMTMMGSSGKSHKGSFGDFSSGRGGFGGFSGGGGFGGFSGGGGGSFGGGGASGSW